MITDPAKYAPVFADAGSDHITFHTECADDPAKVIELIHKLGCSAGISLKPATPVSAVLPWIDMIELVLVMTVEPGFGGQSFMADMMPKVRLIRDEITKRKLKTHVEVDGGIDGKTAVTAAENGANMMVAGTSVFRNPSGARAAVESIVAVQKHLR
jgi:ribulose-phosphate 3-epimerase